MEFMEFLGREWTSKKILEEIDNREVQSIELHETLADDELLFALADRGALTSIYFCNDRVTDAGIRSISQSCLLESLILRDLPSITDKSLEAISKCQSLRELYLDGTSVSNKAIGAVGELPELWSLSISNTAITDTGIEQVRSNHIELICFDHCAVNGTGFSTWSVAEKASLYTVGSPVNDEGFSTICRAFPHLTDVAIEDTDVTNHGLQNLESHPVNLIRIHGSPIDREGVIWLLENLPLQTLECDSTQFTKKEAAIYSSDDSGRYRRVSVYDKND